MSTSKINLNKEILALFSGQSNIVTTPKLYIQLTGSHSLAIVLSQCIFWSNKSKCKDSWFYKEYSEWYDEIHIPERTLRRRFDKLEEEGWISTKVKKVKGLNTKHIRPNMEKIVESISTMLHQDCPDRPDCPDGKKNAQNSCLNIDPTGQLGRLEPATLADSSIDTEEYKQKTTTNCETSSSFFFSKTLDQSLLNEKLSHDKRTDKEFLENVVHHVDNHSKKEYCRMVRAQASLKLLKKLKSENIIFYSTGLQPKEMQDKPQTSMNPFTQEELELVNEYNHALKMKEWGGALEVYMPNSEKRARAQELLSRIKAMEAKRCLPATPKWNARKNSLMSVSNLVSRPNLSQLAY